MRWIMSAILVVLCLYSCKFESAGSSKSLIAMVGANNKCDKVRFIDGATADWAKLDVCGTIRFYEYGSWCEDCSMSWRERK
ncbi:hypothetical protein LCGC14_2684230 [marine sediment metagenome]|uniref:SRCR domain-containing protein n=1 Tax=marine sediment metagenome TaxID=412755 RepID=A0A0F8ZKE6_9ZZZZ